ncbi:MAG: DUF2752 domain-containing protein [Vicinamibacterales bacterium]
MTFERRHLSPDETDHEMIWGWVLPLSAVGLLGLFTTHQLDAVACTFKAITGIACPTCGVTRSLAALLNGDIVAALRMHPLFPPFCAALGVYLPYAWTVVATDRPRIRVTLAERDRSFIRRGVAVATLVVWTFLVADGR